MLDNKFEMELYQIRYFVAVAETLNFTRASQRCYVSQPALTKAIQRLEEDVGGRLFERGKSSVLLSDLGRAMLPDLRRILEGATQAREQARRLAQGRKEVVRVGVMCSIDFQSVLPGFAPAVEGHEAVEMDFREGTHEALTDALDCGEIDLALLSSPSEPHKRFAATPLFREDYVVAIGDDHRFNGRANVELAELDRERYCERTQCEFSSHIERLLSLRGVHLQVVQQSHREDWIQAFVRSNFGVAFMPASIAQAAQLGFAKTGDCPIEREVAVLAQAGRSPTRAQDAVLESLQACDWGSGRAAYRPAPSGK